MSEQTGVHAIVDAAAAPVPVWLLRILFPLLLAAGGWAVGTISASKVDTIRFQLDSTAVWDSLRSVRNFDSAGVWAAIHNNATTIDGDHEILVQINRRVRDIYCTDKPPGCQ